MFLFVKQAESQNNKSYRINSISQDSGDLVHSTFKYSSFIPGEVLYINRPAATADLNYNYLSGQIVFQNEKGETMELAKPETLQCIAINKDTFYYADKNYVELITHYPSVKLARNKVIKFNGKEKKGAYGTYSGTSAATSLDNITDEAVSQKINVDENVIYAASTKYYLADNSYNFIPASKKSFYKVFSQHENKLSAYLKNNTVHFNKEEDLLKLIDYMKAK
ncbi:MAG: hypothetical protein ABI594_07340 [Ginsengibacter sp.]